MNKMYFDLWDEFLNSLCDWCWMEWLVKQEDIRLDEFQMIRFCCKKNIFFGIKRGKLMKDRMKDRMRKEFKLELGI